MNGRPSLTTKEKFKTYEELKAWVESQCYPSNPELQAELAPIVDRVFNDAISRALPPCAT